MKRKAFLPVVIAGSVLFLFSAFFPFGAMHSPYGMTCWTMDAVATSDTAGEAAAFAVAALVIAYPYLWAALVAVLASGALARGWPARPLPHLLFHTVGGGALVSLCVMLLFMQDPWIPAQAQWVGVTLPAVVLALMWACARIKPRERGAWTVVALGFLLQAPLQFTMAYVSTKSSGAASGFLAGGLGALLALAGSIALARRPLA